MLFSLQTFRLHAENKGVLVGSRYMSSSILQQKPLESVSTSLHLIVFCDSNWASCPITWQSITSYFVMLEGFPVSWRTKKSTIVSCSSTKVEYCVMAIAISELIWLHTLLASLRVLHDKLMSLYYDNQATLYIAANLVFHKQTKHIKVDSHFICENL